MPIYMVQSQRDSLLKNSSQTTHLDKTSVRESDLCSSHGNQGFVSFAFVFLESIAVFLNLRSTLDERNDVDQSLSEQRWVALNLEEEVGLCFLRDTDTLQESQR